MKKLFTFLLVMTVIAAFGQNAYYDAVKLSAYLEGDNLKRSSPEVFNILGNYVLRDNPGRTKEQMIDELNSSSNGDPNPFIEISGGQQNELLGNVVAPLKGAFSSTGGLDVTTLADGLAQFLIERAKEELTVTFFNQLKSDLDKVPEIKMLFPETAQFMVNIQGYEYSTFIQTLREVFKRDLSQLATGLRNLRNLQRADCHGDSKCERRIDALVNFFNGDPSSVLFSAATIAIDSLQAGSNVAAMIKAIGLDQQTLHFPEDNTANALRLTSILSESIRSQHPDKIWISAEELKKLRDIRIMKLYLGLVYQDCKELKIKFNGKFLIEDIKPADVEKYQRYITSIVAVGKEVEVQLQDIRSKRQKGEKFTADDYIRYLTTSVNAVEALLNCDPVFSIVATERQNVFSVIHSGISMYYGIKSADYALVVSNCFIILDKTIKEKYKYKEKILRYGSFMAAVTQAQNGQQVNQAIQSAVLPVGSASIKKGTEWNISLNAYLGGFAGDEFLGSKKTGKWKPTSGIAAPIGVAFSHRLGTGSISAFLSVIDLGAVVSYRLKDDSTAVLPNLKLQNLFAPGAGAILGIPKIPLSVGYMWQVGPSLRDINNNAATLSKTPNHRWYFFVAIDIPLINFYSSQRRLRN